VLSAAASVLPTRGLSDEKKAATIISQLPTRAIRQMKGLPGSSQHQTQIEQIGR
jgi:hypothetical protein